MGTLMKIGEITTGLALMSPADEVVTSILTGGADTPIKPVQFGVSFVAGSVLLLHGLGVIK